MKNLIKISILCLSLFFMTNAEVFAQTIGHINSIELLNSLDEWKEAQKTLETFVSQKEKSLTAREKALNDEYTQLLELKESGGLTPKDEQTKGQALQEKVATFERDKGAAQQEILQKEADLIKPIEERIMSAIEAVANENGFGYIFDISNGGIFPYSTANDITSLVKAKL